MTSLLAKPLRRSLRSPRAVGAAALVAGAVLVAATAGLGVVTWVTLVVATVAVVALLRGAPSSLVTDQGFRRVFEDSPTGMVLADLDLQVLDANAAFAAFLGREVEDIVGKNVASYSEPGDMELTRRQHEALLAGTASHYSMDKRYVRADGSLVWGELTVSLLRDDRGRPVATYAQVQDISSHRHAVETLDRRARYNEAAAELGRIALVAADVGELGERLAEVVAQRLDADACTITEVNGMELHSLAVFGEAPGRGSGRALDDARALAGRAGLRHRRPARDRGPGGERRRRVAAAARLGHAQRDGRLGRGPRRPRRHGRGVQPQPARVDRRRVGLPARRRQRHGLRDRARRARGGRRPPLAARPAHRAPEPRAVRRPPHAHARSRPPRRPAARGADRRPRPVQADQRLARPPRRRRAAARGRAAAGVRGARHRHRRALRRRRVRRAVRRRRQRARRRSSSPSGSPTCSTSRS